MKVCIVGGGTAGTQAAAEASRLGSDVVVIEKEEVPDAPWLDLPDLIHPYGTPGFRAPAPPHSVRVLTSEATSCSPGLVTTSREDVRCDSLVLATGSTFEAPAFKGSRKPGVYVLDSEESYRELGSDSGALGRVLVAGEGARALEVTERLTGGGRSIRTAVSHWQAGPPSRPVLDAISRAADERGVSISAGRLSGVVGTAGAEAAVVGGEVVPCDSVVFVPRRLPRVPATTSRLGRTGALLVGRNLAAGTAGTFAAGGCAEVEGSGPPSTLVGEPSPSGRIAGANSLGASLSLGPARSAEIILFGLRWVRVSSRLTGMTLGSLDSAAKSEDGAACEIIFDRPSGKVNVMEFVQPVTSRVIGEALVTPDLNLKALAYGGAGSSDISLVSETARLGLG